MVGRIKTLILAFLFTLCGLCSCSKKIPTLAEQMGVEVIILENSNFTQQEIDSIIKRTNYFCERSGNGQVKRIKITKVSSNTRVSYTCSDYK